MGLLANLFVRLGAQTQDFDRGIAKAASRLKSFGGEMQNAGQAMSIGFTLPLVGVGGAAIKAAGEMEMAQVAFTTMLKSSEKAKAHLEELKKFTLVTPYVFGDLVRASRLMQAYGFAAEEVVPKLKIIGNAVSALGGGSDALERVVRSMGEIGTRGKVTGEQLRELSRAGIPALDAIAQKLGVSAAEAQKQITAGTVDAKTAMEALLGYMETRFGGGMEAQSKTIIGMWSNLRDKITFALADIGAAMLPAAKGIISDFIEPVLDKVRQLTKAFNELPGAYQKVGLGAGALLVAAGPMTWLAGSVARNVGVIGGALGKLGGFWGVALRGAQLFGVGLAAQIGWEGIGPWLLTFTADYKKAEAEIEKLNQALADVGMDIARAPWMSLKDWGAAVSASFDRMWASAKTGGPVLGEIAAKVDRLAEAFKILNVTSFGELATNADLASKAYGNVLTAFRQGKADISDVVSAYRSMMMTQDKLDDSFQDFSSHLEGFLPDLLATSLEARSAIDTLTLGLDLTYFATERMKREFENFGLSARAGITDVTFAMETLKGAGILGAINTMQELGQKSQMELRAIESRAADLYLRLVELKAPALDIKNAYEAWGEASARAAGLTISHAAKMTSAWKELGREISSAFKHMARGIADIIVEGGKMGKVFVDVAKQIAKAIIEIAIMQGVRELIKALSGVTEHLGAIGKALNEWAGVGASAAKTASKTAAAAGAVPGSVSTAGGAAGAAGGGLAGILTAAFTGVSAAMSVVNMFQQMHQETSLNAIEWNTRKSSLHLEALLGNANQFWPWLVSIHDRLMQVVNSPGIPVWSTPANPVWVAGSAGGGGTVTINIYESKSARETAQEVVSLLKRHGIAPAMA